ncbi:MAG: class I SAM-dependent methyltransferase [Thiotrichales bacterium]
MKTSRHHDIIRHIDLPALHRIGITQAQRLFHGRGHAYPGLEHITVDWLPPIMLITLFAAESDNTVAALADWAMQTLPACHSVQCQNRADRMGPVRILQGEPVDSVVVEENDLLFRIRLGRARNMGLFLDMKNGRQWIRQNAQNKRVLNLFAYTCGFSIAAQAGKAKKIVNIDMSSAALSTGRENHRLNAQCLDNIRFEKLDIFKSFGRIRKHGPFDLLICDPPTFQKGSVDIKRDYPKILRRLPEFMAPGAQLMLCLNAPELDRAFLLDAVRKFAPNYQFTGEIAPPEVFAEAQHKGLKTLCFLDGTESLAGHYLLRRCALHQETF